MPHAAEDKQHAFTEALERFHAVASSDSETAQIFLSAKSTLVKKITADVQARRKANASIMPVSQSKEYQDIFYPGGKHSEGPCIVCYLDDAARMYEKRTDAHANETALLFDPRNSHIKAIRTLVKAYTESAVRFAPESKEFKAAKAIEKALDDVQAAQYLPKGKKRNEAALTVYGYSSGEGERVYGTGIVSRNYGLREGIGEYQVIEMSSAGLLPHLAESNAIAAAINHQRRMDARNDMSVICDNGDVSNFNYNTAGKDSGIRSNLSNAWNAGAQDQASIQKIEQLKNAHRAKGAIGISMRPTADEVAVVESQLIPYLEQQLPALTTIPDKQRGR